MSVIFEVMGFNENVIQGINASPLASVEELIIFQLTQQQALLVIF
jgi:hypothetical protein